MQNRIADYQKLKSDDNYTDVYFEVASGGLRATHVLHHFHPEGGRFEKEVAEILFNHGDKIILGKELSAPGERVQQGEKHQDGTYNDASCDICTVLGAGKNTLKKALQHCRKKGAEVAILYFPDASNYSEERFYTGISMFNGTSSYRFREIIIVRDNTVHKKSHH